MNAYTGELSPEWQTGYCGYSPLPRDVTCLADAAWHGISADLKGMASCNQHQPVLASISKWVHPYEPACGLPDARFQKDINRCVIPGDWEDWEGVKVNEGSEQATRSSGSPSEGMGQPSG